MRTWRVRGVERRIAARVFVVAAAAVALCAAVASPAAAQWRRLDSPNFVVIGDAPARDLRDVAVKFEGFRETLSRVLGERATAAPVPTVVIVFQSDTMMAPFRPKFEGKAVDVAGMFVPGRDVNYITMVHDGNPRRLQVVFHEYTHLIASNSDRQLPLWLNEGLAEYYSTFEISGHEAILGGLIGEHLARLNDTVLIPLPELLAMDRRSPLYNEGSRRSVFYAQAWALTHLILLGDPNRAPQLSDYLLDASNGQDPVEAWQKAFGAVDMQRELEQYIRQQMFHANKYKFSDELARFDSPAVTIPPADAQAFLSDLLVQLGDYDAAAARLAQSTKIDAAVARARVAAIRLAMARKQAPPENAVFADLPTPGDWFLAYMAGVTTAALIEERGGAPVAADLDTVRRFLTAAEKAHADIPHAVARLTTLELESAAGPTAETTAALERVRKVAPARYEYAFLHAEILVQQREFAKARDVVAPFMAGYPTPIRNAARSLMGFIVGLEYPSGASPRSAPPDALPPASGDATPTPTSTSAPASHPLFRVTKPDEQRAEGTLERIDCILGRGVVLEIKAGDTVGCVGADAQHD